MDARSTMPLWVVLFLLCWEANAQVKYMKYKDPMQPVEVRVNDLLKRMTLAEKIGQMTQIERNVATDDVIKQYFIGSLVSGGGSYPSFKASAMEWIDMINSFQKAALSTRLGIPLLYGIDAVHGHNTVYNATIFPHNIGLGVTRDPNLIKKIGVATALELRATGIPYTFAPCIAVCRDPRWGRCYESYSEDHHIVQAMTDIILGLQGDVPTNYQKNFPYIAGRDKVLACSKHFVGDGGTQNGIDEYNTILNPHELFKIHMPAYLDAIRKGVSTVMLSYSSWNGVRMHTNHQLITDYLKNKLGFMGFTISDWEGIERVTVPWGLNYSHSLELVINAGIDMIMEPTNYLNFIGNLTNFVHSKTVHIGRINDAVRRILRVKFLLGLFENPYADTLLVHKLGCQEHRDLAREAVRKSLVLLKNGEYLDEPMLPLPKNVPKILVAGTHADNLGYQCGGWTREWQGISGNDFTTGTNILEAIMSSVDPETEVVYSENPEPSTISNSNFSCAIVVVGEKPYAEYVGDNANLTIPEPGLTTVQNVCGAMRCVVVLVTGRPLVIEPYLHSIDALVAAWLPGTEGSGVTDVLFGDYGFTGKLSRTWFRSVEQLPMNVGDEHYDPLFPFGYGLTTRPNVVFDSR